MKFSFYNFLYSKDGIVLTMLVLMSFYVPLAAFLMKHTGHLDWVFAYYCGYAFAFEIGILMIMVNGNAKTGELTGKIYSIASGCFVLFYYLFLDDYGSFVHWQDIPIEKIPPAILLSAFHSMLIWNLVDILKTKLEESRSSTKVDPRLIQAQKQLNELQAQLTKAERTLREKQLELNKTKREFIQYRISRAKGKKTIEQLEAELEAI